MQVHNETPAVNPSVQSQKGARMAGLYDISPAVADYISRTYIHSPASWIHLLFEHVFDHDARYHVFVEMSN